MKDSKQSARVQFFERFLAGEEVEGEAEAEPLAEVDAVDPLLILRWVAGLWLRE
jgi:hypothetical protein